MAALSDGGPEETTSLDGRTVQVVDRATEWVVLDSLFLKELRVGATASSS
ncbi:hypothetical protein NLX86_09715 [Streptomyces sp. A3M-1-3]|nr:hypothetical protein [Streptomyces sp. A3M-1-3]MCP3818382.1 hypothetical protein [Streptomyces sp. A3M-1-3]